MQKQRWGDRIRLALELRGVTQRQLAAEIDQSESAVSHYIKNTKEPTGKAYSAIARALDINVDWLMHGKGRPPSSLPGQAMKLAEWRMRKGYEDFGRDYGNPAWLIFEPRLDSVVREVTQNVRDAGVDGGRTILVVRLHKVTGERLQRFREASGWEQLEPHVRAAAAQKGRFGSILERGLEAMKNDLVVATFNDFGTVGLIGSELGDEILGGRHEHFAALVRHTFDSQKESSGAGGSYGLGKNAAIASSLIRTVYYNSTLTVPVDGQREHRFIGRTDLGARRLSDGTSYAGPGWFGAPYKEKAAISIWGDRARMEALFLYRDHENPDATGTSVLIPGFYDPSSESSSIATMAQNIAKAAGRSFWPAIVDEKLEVIVETYDNDDLLTRVKVEPEAYRPEAVAMYTAYKTNAIKEALDEEGGVVGRNIRIDIPRRKANGGPAVPDTNHSVVLLIERAEDDGDDVNTVAGFRSPGMIVQERRYPGLGSVTKFRSVLIVGRAAEDTAAGESAELFFAAAEPPAHDKWTHTSVGLSEAYRGGRATLNRLEEEIRSTIREVLQTARSAGTGGPESILKHFVMPASLSDEDVDNPPPPPPRGTRIVRVQPLKWQDVNGERRVAVTLRVPPKLSAVVTPALMCRFEDGGATRVPIKSLAAISNCKIESDGTVKVDGSLGNDAQFLVDPDWDAAGLDPAYSVLSFDVSKQLESPRQ